MKLSLRLQSNSTQNAVTAVNKYSMSSLNEMSLPLGTSTFRTLRSNHEIYVDKTEMLYELCSKRRKIFLSRPRRFGKSLLTSTFASLFLSGLQDFAGLKIADLWSDASYQVVKLDFSFVKDFDSIEDFERQLLAEIAEAFAEVGYSGDPDFSKLGQWLLKQPSSSIVLLIDEYDAPLTACLDDPETFKSVQRILNKFFSRVKAGEGCLRFFFMTGVTKLSQTGIFSGFNNLVDISLDPRYASLLGYTEDEIRHYFSSYTAHAAEQLNCSEGEVINQLRDHYNGFCFDETAQKRVYCPWSVLNFLDNPGRGFKNYWYSSGGQPAVLMKYLSHHELADPANYAKERIIRLSALGNSQTYDEMKLEALLFQAGYLTIKAAIDDETVRIGYPNMEVSDSMARLYADELLGGKDFAAAPTLVEVLKAKGLDDIVQRFNRVFNAVDYQRYPVKDEATCRAYLQVLMIGADLVPQVELHTALGRSDLEVAAGGRRWVFEVKFAEKDADSEARLREGIAQIQSRRYGETHEGRPPKQLLRAVIVFSGESRRFVRWAQV